MKKNDDVEVEGQALLLVEEEEINDEVKPLYAGHVVAVVDRIPGQIFAGTLGLLRPAQAAQALTTKDQARTPPCKLQKLQKLCGLNPPTSACPLLLYRQSRHHAILWTTMRSMRPVVYCLY